MMLERGSWLTEGKLPAKLGEDEELSSQPPLEMAADKLSLFQWRELCVEDFEGPRRVYSLWMAVKSW
jgi:hypothetical protein